MIDRLAQENVRHREVTHTQSQDIERLENDVFTLKQSTLSPTSGASKSSETPEPDTRSQFTGFACTGAYMTLTCPGNRTIFLNNGTYGQHALACSVGCCPRNPEYDCTELVEENRPQDWLAIQALCDGEQSCQFENIGYPVDTCEEGYLSDYMQLFYDCSPDDETGPVAFTAWANTGGSTPYNQFDIVVFDEVLTNFGGHYNPATSSFICPVDGVYHFSTNTLGAISSGMFTDLMRNNLPCADVCKQSDRRVGPRDGDDSHRVQPW